MKQRSMNFIKKAVNLLLDVLIVLLGLILLITIYNNVQVKLLGNDYSSFFGHSVFEVQTGSMSDTINAGDWIIVKYTNNIKLNDIVTFEHKGEFITHRVIEAYNGTYVTKGDANNAKDKPINKDQIVGKVVYTLPGFGILRKTIFNPLVLIALIITLYLVNITFKKTSDSEKTKEMILLEKAKDFILSKLSKIKFKKDNDDDMDSLDFFNDVVKTEVKKPEVKKVPIKEDEEVTKEEVAETYPIAENVNLENTADMEKTVYFRMVSVDHKEISNVYADGEFNMEEASPVSKLITKEETTEEPKKAKKEEKETIEEVSEDKVKSILELIQKRKRKSRNFIEKAIMIKEDELNEIINILNENNEMKPNEPTIIENYTKAYIDAKYYNDYSNITTKSNTKNAKIEAVVKKVATTLTKTYNGPDTKYADKVEKFAKYFLLINQLEQDYKAIENLQTKKDSYNKKILKYINYNSLSSQDLKVMISKILKVQRTYESTRKFILNKLDTNMFELKLNKLAKNNHYGVELQHNISFSKVYSDYIVDKTYSEGVVAEDKIEVLASLLSSQLIKDMFDGAFNKKYVIYIPETLYTKQNKLDKIFKMFDDEFAKNSISIVMQFEELADKKKIIKKLMKEGYKFSVDLNSISLIKKRDIENLYIADYIFVTKQKANKTNILDIIPAEVKENILYDDITTKVGFWGE